MRRRLELGQQREYVDVVEEPGPGQPGRVLWPDGMLTEITLSDLETLAAEARRKHPAPRLVWPQAVVS